MTGNSCDHLGAYLDQVLIGGRRPVSDVVLVEYDEEWPRRYATHAKRIRTVLGIQVLALEHIGSTAVPGLAAKPVVDILLCVSDPDDHAAYQPALEAAGYQLRVREPGHRMFWAPEGVQVHVCAPGCAEVADYLLFRDRLRASPSDRRCYERTKRELAGRPWPDINYYAEAKGEVIRAILARARAENDPLSGEVNPRASRT